MEITIGTEFEKKVGSSSVKCIVDDIIEIEYESTKTGMKTYNTVYLATSELYGMGKSFEVPRATITRSLLTK